MAICPSCQAQIEIGSEFFGGLFTCPQCQSVYFIGFDGAPESAQPSSMPLNDIPDQAMSSDPVPETQVDAPSGSYEEGGAPLDFGPLETTPIENEIVSSEEPQGSFGTASGEVIQPISSPLQEVVDFANEEGATSIASYTVEIRGLELSQNLHALREILTDSKLQLNFDEIKAQIKNGVLKLEKLNPAQAAVVAFRLRPMQMEMIWEQNLL